MQQDFYVFAQSPLFRSLYHYLYSFFVEVSLFWYCWSQQTKGTSGCIVSDIPTESQVEKMSLSTTPSMQPPQEIVPNQVWTFVLGPSSGPRQMVIENRRTWCTISITEYHGHLQHAHWHWKYRFRGQIVLGDVAKVQDHGCWVVSRGHCRWPIECICVTPCDHNRQFYVCR